MSIPSPAPASGHAFVTTQWTRVLEARGNSPDAKAALSDLCAAYYAPVFAFVRRNSSDENAARDLTQEFFARLLAGRALNADPQRGRFRSYLLAAVKNFLADMRDHANAAKRGGGQVTLSIEGQHDTATGLEIQDANAVDPEREFDRKWALTVLDRALGVLSAEHATPEDQKQFQVLKPWLTGDNENISQAKAAGELGCSESAAKVAIHRLRKRFRELVKAEIRQTMSDPAQVADELACLVAALSSK
ncbi:MAG TPA: sigma-70 family RNA polymerase sigma factor [Candidatus Limnocylindria bacterium]|nr:sigma-70 family RNA polymerase sigma factor [Candidatus Limnocylindria bacterium]